MSDECQMVMSSTVGGPLQKKLLCKGFNFSERYADGFFVRNEVNSSGWIADSQEFIKIDG